MSYEIQNTRKKQIRKLKKKYGYIPEGQPGWDSPGSKSLFRHNARVYKSMGWKKGKDGRWRP